MKIKFEKNKKLRSFDGSSFYQPFTQFSPDYTIISTNTTSGLVKTFGPLSLNL